MLIKKLTLDNFRSHASTSFDLSRITVFRSPNGGGKTSIENAIEIVLGGRTEATSADGKGSSALIRAGQKKASITLELSTEGGPRTIECALNGSSIARLASNPEDPQWTGETKLLDFFGKHRQTFSCLCNNRYFVELPEKDQKDILAAIILPTEYTWPEWVKPACRAVGIKMDWERTPFGIIEAGYDAAFKARTDINRDVKNFKIPEGDTSMAELVDEIKARLDERNGELESLLKEQAAKVAGLAGAVKQREQIEKRITQAEERLTREHSYIDTFDSQLLSAAKVKEYEKTVKGGDRAKALDVTTGLLQLEIASLKAQMKRFNELSLDPACPTCKSPLTEEVMAALVQPIVDQIEAKHSELNAAFDERKKLGDVAAAEKALDAHKQATKDMERAKSRVAEEQNALNQARSELESLPAPQAANDDTKTQMAFQELRERIQKGNHALQEALAARSLADRQLKAKGDLAELQGRQKDVERLVEYFGSKGVKAELLAASIGSFADGMNAVLGTWGYQCALTIEPYSFTVTFGNFPIALKSLSKSQRYRFSAAFQVALAMTTGFNFVVVDEADIYDAAGRAGLFEMLMESDLDQAIVLATDDRTEVPVVEGLTFYRLDNSADAGELPTTVAMRL